MLITAARKIEEEACVQLVVFRIHNPEGERASPTRTEAHFNRQRRATD